MSRFRSLDPRRPNKETSIERLMKQALLYLRVPFREQGYVGRYRPDFILPDLRVVVECDGTFWHSTPRQIQHDRHKDQIYKASGYHVYRFTDKEIRQNPIACVRRILNDFPTYVPAFETPTE